jgi:hypothetical protein
MTDDQALQEAQRRWGQNAHVRYDAGSAPDSFKVGVRHGAIFHVKGVGESWEEAFRDANRRKTPPP